MGRLARYHHAPFGDGLSAPEIVGIGPATFGAALTIRGELETTAARGERIGDHDATPSTTTHLQRDRHVSLISLYSP